jgi:translation initiation factor 1
MILMVSDYNNSNNSIDELVKELDKSESNIVITQDIRKYRKPVTIISGLNNRSDAKEITKQLKTKIGTGGTYKDGQIILQGDHREAAKNLLVGMGFAEESIEVY